MKSIIRFILKLVFRSNSINQKLLIFFFREVRTHYSKKLSEQYGHILGGEFQGLKIPQTQSHQNFTFVQVSGFYEQFLQEIIVNKVGNYKKLIDIGSGTGFYTAGIAYKCGIPTVGVELDAKQVNVANEISKLNGLEKNVTHYAESFGYDVFKYLENGALHLIDIEGGEYPILRSIQPEDYKDSCFIIELHEFGDTNVDAMRDLVEETFSKTHKVTHVKENCSKVAVSDEAYQAFIDTGVPRQVSEMLLTVPRELYHHWSIVEPK